MISVALILTIVGIALHVIGFLIGRISANTAIVKDLEGLVVRIEDALKNNHKQT